MTTTPQRRARAMSERQERDMEVCRALLARGPQAAFSFEADDAFAEAVNVRPMTAAGERNLHRRRVAALRALVRAGEATTEWVGIQYGASHHGPNRTRIYRAALPHRAD